MDKKYLQVEGHKASDVPTRVPEDVLRLRSRLPAPREDEDASEEARKGLESELEARDARLKDHAHGSEDDEARRGDAIGAVVELGLWAPAIRLEAEEGLHEKQAGLNVKRGGVEFVRDDEEEKARQADPSRSLDLKSLGGLARAREVDLRQDAGLEARGRVERRRAERALQRRVGRGGA